MPPGAGDLRHPRRQFFTGADIVLPDRVVAGHTVITEGDHILDIVSGDAGPGPDDVHHDCRGALICPGFIDVHVHGVLGVDVMDDRDAIHRVARALPWFGVTAFCPTSIACAPETLDQFLGAVGDARVRPQPAAARVLPAHIESAFINPAFRGAQPLEHLQTYSGTLCRTADVGIFTMAPEMPGGMALIDALLAAGVRVSLGHSGATYEQAIAAVDAGARHATHLFNRMTPLTHREPGLVGAILEREDIAAEIIGDGFHVHPAAARVAIAAKGRHRVMAITDGTAGSGLPAGTCATLGGRRITVSDTARLDDGTLAGSVATMDRVFATLVTRAGQSLVDAAALCATTPARELGLTSQGSLVPGQLADFVVLSQTLQVRATFVGGEQAPPRPS